MHLDFYLMFVNLTKRKTFDQTNPEVLVVFTGTSIYQLQISGGLQSDSIVCKCIYFYTYHYRYSCFVSVDFVFIFAIVKWEQIFIHFIILA